MVLPWPGGRGSAFSGQRVAAPYPPNAVCLGRCGTGVRELCVCVWGGAVALASPPVFEDFLGCVLPLNSLSSCSFEGEKSLV